MVVETHRPGYFEVWLEGRLALLLHAASLSDALATCVAEFPRRALRVRPITVEGGTHAHITSAHQASTGTDGLRD